MNWQRGNFQTYVSAVDMRCDLNGRTILPTGTEFEYDGFKVVIDGDEATIAPPSFRSAVARGWLRQDTAQPIAEPVAAALVTPAISGLTSEGEKFAASLQGSFPDAFQASAPAPSAPPSRPSFAAANPPAQHGVPRAMVGRADIEGVSVTVGRPGEMPAPSEGGAFVSSSTMTQAQPSARFPLSREAPVGVVRQPVMPRVRTAAAPGVAPRQTFPLVSNESEVTRVFPLTNDVAPTQSQAAVAPRGAATITPVVAASGDTNLSFNPGQIVRDTQARVGPALQTAVSAPLKPEVAQRRNLRKLEVVQQSNPGFTWDFALDLDAKVQMALGNLHWLSAIFLVEEPEVITAIQTGLTALQT